MLPFGFSFLERSDPMGGDKGLLFLILGFSALWLVMDEFAGGKRLTALSKMLTPDLSGIGDVVKEKVLEEGEKLDEKAPGIFFSPKNKEDKKKWEDAHDGKGKPKSLYEHWKQSIPGEA